MLFKSYDHFHLTATCNGRTDRRTHTVIIVHTCGSSIYSILLLQEFQDFKTIAVTAGPIIRDDQLYSILIICYDT